MRLFSAPQPLDPTIAKVYRSDRTGDKRVAAEQQFILSELRRTNEEPLLVAYDMASGEVLVITTQRSFLVKRGKLRKQFDHSEIAETRINVRQNAQVNGFLAILETYSAQRDYHPADAARYQKIIQVNVASDAIAQEICAIVDRIAGLA